jgi:hypothetical protein
LEIRVAIGTATVRLGILNGLFSGEKTGVGSALTYAQADSSHALRTPALVCGSVEVAVDSGINAATVEANTDPRSTAQTLLVWLRRIFDTVDFQVIGGRFFH